MTKLDADIIVVGSGPVGLMCSYLAGYWGLKTMTLDKNSAPISVGRADAFNARSLQLLEIAKIFDQLFPKGKACNTSSVWKDGRFVSRSSSWWEELEGCFHKHFLMLGQRHLEQCLDNILIEKNNFLLRNTEVESVLPHNDFVEVTVNSGRVLRARYVIGADGAHSQIRKSLGVPFEIERPEITWAVIDATIKTTFPKVPEIIVFQNETSDVAWIPREGLIDRFYIRIDRDHYTIEELRARIAQAMTPHLFEFEDIEWHSHFTVRESVAGTFRPHPRVFLAGDACHIHSVNGGQGLNTGLADAFNLMWRLGMSLNWSCGESILIDYDTERRPVAKNVVAASADLVRATKFSETNTHAIDYVNKVSKWSDYITGMGIAYGADGCTGSRVYDFIFKDERGWERIYSRLSYSKFSLLAFDLAFDSIPVNHDFIAFIHINSNTMLNADWNRDPIYENCALLVRPDGYIERVFKGHKIYLHDIEEVCRGFKT
jgi:2-polyprenyl-6-methoxyphenol hydroxylase-like FAD-dependent oxidoreductase